MIEENAVQVGTVIEVGTPKNHKMRTVPLPKFLAEGLARHCAGKGREDLVFAGEDGHDLRLARVHEDNMSWFVGAVKRAGIPRITPTTSVTRRPVLPYQLAQTPRRRKKCSVTVPPQ